MTKAAFNALITEYSVERINYDNSPFAGKEGHVGLAIISDPAGDLWHLFVNNKPVKVKIVDKDSCFDFTERKVERERDFNVRLKDGSFQCSVSVQYYINGTYHHSRNTTYSEISVATINRLYNPSKAIDLFSKRLFEKNFGFCIHSNVERTDLLPTRKQFDKDEVYSLLESIVHHRFLAGSCHAHKNYKAHSKHNRIADEAFTELLTLLDMED